MKARLLLVVIVIVAVPVLYLLSSGPILKLGARHGSLRLYDPLLRLKIMLPDSLAVILDDYWKLWGISVKLAPIPSHLESHQSVDHYASTPVIAGNHRRPIDPDIQRALIQQALAEAPPPGDYETVLRDQ